MACPSELVKRNGRTTYISEPRFNRCIAVPGREQGGSSFPDAGLHDIEDSRATLHRSGEHALEGADGHTTLALGQDDRSTLGHRSTRQMDGGLSAKRSGLEGIEIDQLDVGPVGSSPGGQPGRAGAHHIAEGDGGIDEGEGGGVDSGAQFAAVVGQDDNVDGYARTWEQVEEDGRLHGLLGQVGLLDEASVSLRIG